MHSAYSATSTLAVLQTATGMTRCYKAKPIASMPGLYCTACVDATSCMFQKNSCCIAIVHRMPLSHQLMPDDVSTILTSNVLTLINRVFHRACSHIACDLSLCAGMTATFSFVPKESAFENREMSPRSMIMRVIVYVVLQIMNRCS